MTKKRYYAHKHLINEDKVHDKICHKFMNISETVEHMNMYYQKYTALKKENEQLKKENKNLKAQLYSDEDGICNQCKYHYLIKDEDSELGYYRSRCRKGHYECARVSLVHCEDFEVKNGDVE